jgi:hypothetical protein
MASIQDSLESRGHQTFHSVPKIHPNVLHLKTPIGLDKSRNVVGFDKSSFSHLYKILYNPWEKLDIGSSSSRSRSRSSRNRRLVSQPLAICFYQANHAISDLYTMCIWCKRLESKVFAK